MLSVGAFVLLADRGRISDPDLRIFLALVRDYDLRDFRVIQLRPLAKDAGLRTKALAAQALVRLSTSGLLEMGPALRGTPTWRIPPRHLLAGPDLKQWLRDKETARQLEALVPAVEN